MERRALFIRAINVGGTAILPMAELRDILESHGGEDVATYIQSGNAVLTVPGDPEVFHRSVENAIQARYGWFREVTSRTPEELRRALAAHPFEVIDERFSYLSFITAPSTADSTAPSTEPSGAQPTADAIAAASAMPTGDDRWALMGRELHLRYANGAGRATLNHEALTRRLGISATARNFRTVAKIISLSE